MKKYLQMLCLLAAVIAVCSCASKDSRESSSPPEPVAAPEPVVYEPMPPPSHWPYEEDSIHLDLKADSQLNISDNTPHTLLVCAYQLRNLTTFNELAGDDDGLYQLLECSAFDSSVRSSKTVIVHPGKRSTVSLDRAEDTKYVAIVAGYYSVDKNATIRLFDIPLVAEKKGLFGGVKTSKPGTLNIKLALGPQQISTPSQMLRETLEAQRTMQEGHKTSEQAEETTEEAGKSIEDTMKEIKETGEKIKETGEKVQDAAETVKKAQKAGETIQKTNKAIPKGLGR